MSKLSELLNPAPNSHAPLPNIMTDVDNHHNRYPSITSPLEALAIAATASASDTSPIEPSGAAPISSNNQYQNHSDSSSRPGSSHFSLPMPPNFSQTPNQPQHPFSPAFEHHPHVLHQNGVRRLSDIADGTSRELPPLRGLTSDEMDQSIIAYPGGGFPTHSRQSSGDIPTYEQTIQIPGIANVQGSSPPSDRAGNGAYDSQVQYSSSEHVQQSKPIIGHTDLKSELVEEARRPKVEQINGHEEIATLTEPAATVEDLLLPKLTAELTREDSTKVSAIELEAAMPLPSTSSTTKAPISRKRPAPKAEKKIEKKGTASAIKKPGAKRRRIDTESMDGTPFSHRSATPASSRASRTPAPIPAPRYYQPNSTTPLHSSPAPANKDTSANEDDDMEDGELFCICRKPDDHTWMIACDGGCEDWFHGRCVNMDERDGNLIDKYICPNCREKGIGQTTWKPMCRLDSCREPARATGAKPSKYCCDEHGEQFMRKRALGEEAKREEKAKATSTARKRRKDNYTDHIGNGDDVPMDMAAPEDEDEQSHLRGGILRAGELNALTNGVKDLDEFRKLGEGVLSPPRTASPDNHDEKPSSSTCLDSEKAKLIYSPEEQTQIAEIGEKKTSLKRQRAALDDREKFLGLVKNRAKAVLDELKRKEGVKDICGFDSRLSWSDEEFDTWRTSSEGRSCLESGILSPPSAPPSHPPSTDKPFTNGITPTADDSTESSRGVCLKKRCERHKTWYKLQQQDIAFEKEECRQEMRKLEREEKGVGERAMVRQLEGRDGGGGGKEVDGMDGMEVEAGAED